MNRSCIVVEEPEDGDDEILPARPRPRVAEGNRLHAVSGLDDVIAHDCGDVFPVLRVGFGVHCKRLKHQVAGPVLCGDEDYIC